MTSRPLQAASVAWLLTSVGHTLAANEWQPTPDFVKVNNVAKTSATTGWYQGSGLFLLLSVLNYKWAVNPANRGPEDKAIVSIAVAIIWSSSAFYFKKGLTSNAVITAVVGALQSWAYFS